MRRLRPSVCLIVLCLASGSSRTQEWIRTMDGGHLGTDEVLCVAATPDDDVVVAGQVDLGSYRCGALAKYSAAGDRVWFTKYDPYPGYASLVSHVAVAASGETFAAAACRDSSDVQRLAVLKLSADGLLSREYRYSHPDHLRDYPCGLLLDSDSHVLVVGSSKANATDYDALVMKCDTTCQPVWQTRYDLEGDLNRPTSMASDSDGSVYVVGSGTANALTVGTVLKVSTDGDTVWTRVERAPGEAVEFESVAVAGDFVYAIGFRSFGRARAFTVRYTGAGDTAWTRERIEGAPKAAVAVDTLGVIHADMAEDSTTSVDVKTIAYSRDGQLKWVRRYDGPAHIYDAPTAMATDPTRGAVYVAGYSQGIGSGWDCTILSYDLDGDLRWLHRFAGDGGTGHDAAQAMVLDGVGSVIVAGYATRTQSDKDWLLIKYPPSGPGIGETAAREERPSHLDIDVAPSVAHSACFFSVNAASSGRTLLICDVNGRVVRRLSASQPHGVSMQAVWSLDDDSGHQVPNGVYFVTLDAPGQSACAKIVVQR